MANTVVKTPIQYYGGKTAIVNNLLEMVPVHEVYTETFFGGGALFWLKEPCKAETINDKKDVVVNFYRVLKHHYKPLKKLIDATLISRTIHWEALRIIRSHDPKIKTSVAAKVKLAWAFWLTSNFAYSNNLNGGYKYANNRRTSVPDDLAYNKRHFTELLVKRIESVYIENNDAVKILKSRNSVNAFHYQDPPYPNADQGHYSGYHWDEYEKLLSFNATDCKGKFLLSSYNSPMLDKYVMGHGWFKKEIKTTVNHRKKSVEVLVSNYDTACGTLKLF
jgi:DNA adenine methylase